MVSWNLQEIPLNTSLLRSTITLHTKRLKNFQKSVTGGITLIDRGHCIGFSYTTNKTLLQPQTVYLYADPTVGKQTSNYCCISKFVDEG